MVTSLMGAGVYEGKLHIDCDKEICLSRAKDENWKKYIEEWFESFQE